MDMMRFRVEINHHNVSPEDWLRWCEADTNGISGPGATGNHETLYLHGKSEQDARAQIEACLFPGMDIVSIERQS